MEISKLKARAYRAATNHAGSPLLILATLLWARLRQDRLALTASSLTYTTVLALVPLLTVVLSVFTLFPAFEQMEGALQQWLLESLIPADIASNVMDYLAQFTSKASQLGMVGIGGLAVIALSLILTVDRTLNQIWRVHDKRLLGQRILVYWAALTLGPLVIGASLAITSYVVSTSRGWFTGTFGGADFALTLLQFALVGGGLTLLYRFVPNAPVRWAHALIGALFVTVALALAKWGLGIYLARVPTYAHIYGAFAAVPILLLWIYVSWLIVLFGAVIAACLPSIVRGARARDGQPGWEFELALDVMGALMSSRGRTRLQLARELKIDVFQLGPVLAALRDMDWVGRLATQRENEEPRYVLLVSAAQPVLPLVDRLLLGPQAAVATACRTVPLAELTLSDVLRAAPAHEWAESPKGDSMATSATN